MVLLREVWDALSRLLRNHDPISAHQNILVVVGVPLHSWGGAAPPYISAGAAMPSSASPLASVRRVAAVNARRAVRVGSGEVSTGQAW